MIPYPGTHESPAGVRVPPYAPRPGSPRPGPAPHGRRRFAITHAGYAPGEVDRYLREAEARLARLRAAAAAAAAARAENATMSSAPVDRGQDRAPGAGGCPPRALRAAARLGIGLIIEAKQDAERITEHARARVAALHAGTERRLRRRDEAVERIAAELAETAHARGTDTADRTKTITDEIRRIHQLAAERAERIRATARQDAADIRDRAHTDTATRRQAVAALCGERDRHHGRLSRLAGSLSAHGAGLEELGPQLAAILGGSPRPSDVVDTP